MNKKFHSNKRIPRDSTTIITQVRNKNVCLLVVPCRVQIVERVSRKRHVKCNNSLLVLVPFNVNYLIYKKYWSKWNHRYQTINLVYVIITTKFYSYKLSLENHWAPHDHSKWNVQKCWRIKMIEHLSSLHSCCEYCDTDNIQLSNKVCISYTEKHELTNKIWRTFLLSN